MPKQPRWGYKRTFDQAIASLVKSGEYLMVLADAGYKDHPQFADDMKKTCWHILEAARLCTEMKERI